jgi:thiol-disulfide isomerase/thioredoxin
MNADPDKVSRRLARRRRAFTPYPLPTLKATLTAGLIGLLTSGAALAVEVGAAAPPIDIAGTTGRVTLAQYRGRTVWLDLWASWCGPCKQSFPWLNAMQEKYGAQGLQVLGVNLDAHAADAQRFLAEHPAHFALGFDPTGATPRSYQAKGMPTSVLIGADGRVLAVHNGFRESEQAELEQQIRNALGVHP